MKFSANERNTLWLTGIGHFGAHFAMLVFPTAAVAISRSEGVALETVLGWSFAGYLIFGLGGLPVGVLTDHVRARWVVRAGVLGLGPALMAVALAEPGPELALALAAVGVFASLYHPAGLGLLSRTVRARGAALGLNGIAGNIGIAGAPVATQLLATSFGWRAAYLVLGALVLAAGAAVAALKIDEPQPGEELRDEHHHAGRERMILFFMLLCAMTLGGLSYRANTVAQPAYYAERVAFVGYGVATSLVYTVSALGQYVAGRLADRYDLRWLYVAFHAFSLPFIIGMTAASGLPLMALASGFVFFSIGMQPIENSLVARFTPDRWRATGYGLKFTVVFGIGALSVPGVKYLMRAYSLSAVFGAAAAVVTGIVVVALLLAWRTRNAPIYNVQRAAARPSVGSAGEVY